jgi:DNA-directed RNA polymerase specialized sigma24 family protein
MPDPRDEKMEAFESLYLRYSPKMYRVATKLGVPSADALDIVQGIFMVYVMHAHEVENVEAYLRGCLLGACRRHLAPPGAEAPLF